MVVATRADQRDALAVRVVQCALHGRDDRALLQLLLRRGGGVVDAVHVPGVDVERHVDHVEADVGAVGERVDDGLQEERPRVLAAADVDQRHVRRDAGDAEAVGSGADGAGDVRAVAAVVVVVRVDATAELTRAVEHATVGVVRDVDREVARELVVEVRRDVRVRAVHTGVENADVHALVAGLLGPAMLERTRFRPHRSPSSGSMPAVDLDCAGALFGFCAVLFSFSTLSRLVFSP